MGRKYLLLALGLVLLLAILGISRATLAQTSPNFNLEWHVIGNSTVGQGSASSPYLSGEHYVIAAGFWGSGGVSYPYSTYLPLVMRNSP
jgi:hypothetical protein